MYRIVTTFKDDSVPFTCHDVSAFNMEHCKILAFAIANRYLGDIPLGYYRQDQGRFVIWSNGCIVGGIGFGLMNDIESGGTHAVRI